MSDPAFEQNYNSDFDRNYFTNHVKSLIDPTITQFKKILRTHTLFHFIFISLIFSEVLYFLLNFPLLIQTFAIAINLALIFATTFSYFTLQIYAQTSKDEQLIKLKNQFIDRCKDSLFYSVNLNEQSLIIAEACCTLAAELHGQEYHLYSPPEWLAFTHSSIEKLSCLWFWKDIHLAKELLLLDSIQEHIKIVRLEPTDLEAHAGLANAYVMLSGLYVDPKTVEGLDDERWIPPNKFSDEFVKSFRRVAEKAIEEFKILSDYAPHDPWVHAQLAYSYHDLHMPEEEISEYETIAHLCPDDKEILYKLGKLYFEYGKNAKGLQIYETLKQANFKKAEQLIHFYGA